MRAISYFEQKASGTSGTVEQISNDAGSSDSGRWNRGWNSGTAKRDGDAFVPPVPPAKEEISVLSENEAAGDVAAESLPQPFQNFGEWAEDLARWALAQCLFRDGCL